MDLRKGYWVDSMKNSDKIRETIVSITSSRLYEGDYGDCASDTELILGEIESSKRKYIPDDYIEFMKNFGFGEIDAALYINDGPTKYSKICGKETPSNKNLYVFAGDSSELLYAFDVSENFSIIEISAESDEVEIIKSTFS